MKDLTTQRCFNHGTREAVARCLECARFFCRECVTEHDDRVLCASCLNKVCESPVSRFRLGGLVSVIQFLIGGIVLWIFFYYLGEALLSVPASFHEGTLWQNRW